MHSIGPSTSTCCGIDGVGCLFASSIIQLFGCRTSLPHCLFTSLTTVTFSRRKYCSLVTLEDVFEELLQEQIYDEMDQMEKEAARIARWASRKWRKLKKRRKLEAAHKASSMGSVVVEALAAFSLKEDVTGEATFLLAKEVEEKDTDREQDGGILGFFRSLGRNNSLDGNTSGFE